MTTFLPSFGKIYMLKENSLTGSEDFCGKALCIFLHAKQPQAQTLQEYMPAHGPCYNAYIELLQKIGTDNIAETQNL